MINTKENASVEVGKMDLHAEILSFDLSVSACFQCVLCTYLWINGRKSHFEGSRYLLMAEIE